MADDSWKDQALNPEGGRDYADYMARLFKVFVEEFQKHGFNRTEAIQIAIAIVPTGLNPADTE